MPISPRVVGNPTAGRLLGQASVEAFTENQRRRSGIAEPTPARAPSPEHVVPKVIYVPLPPPPSRHSREMWHDEPRVSSESEWASRLSALSDDARAQCGLPPLTSPARDHIPQPWPGTMPSLLASEGTATHSSDDSASSERSAAPLLGRKPRLWRRIFTAFRCLRGR